MSERCQESRHYLDRIAAGATEAEQLAWEDHLGRCDECRDQWTADLELRAFFHEAEMPSLSNRFDQTLRRRIAADVRTHPRWLFVIMQAYWFSAAIVSLLILFLVDLPGLSGEGAWIVGGLIPALCFLAPVLLMGLHLKTSLFELISSTLSIRWGSHRRAGEVRNGTRTSTP